MEKQEISFRVDDPEYIKTENRISNPPSIEILKITKDGFYYKGERVDDIHNVYERFNDWLKLAENNPHI